jgi:hypothetical protein
LPHWQLLISFAGLAETVHRLWVDTLNLPLPRLLKLEAPALVALSLKGALQGC